MTWTSVTDQQVVEQHEKGARVLILEAVTMLSHFSRFDNSFTVADINNPQVL
jgi:hypothetical protein